MRRRRTCEEERPSVLPALPTSSCWPWLSPPPEPRARAPPSMAFLCRQSFPDLQVVRGSPDAVGVDVLPVLGQSALLTSFAVPDLDAWKIHSLFELMGLIFAGAVGSGMTFYLQSWCITVRGPLYSAMFNPLCTVITTVVATLVLHEQPHVGSLLGAIAVVAGLYVVLWGKAGDAKSQRVPADTVDLEKTLARSDSQLDAASAITEPLLADGNRTEK